MVTYVGVSVSITVRVRQEQHVDVHGVEEGGQGGVFAIISGNLSKNNRHQKATHITFYTFSLPVTVGALVL